MRFNKPQSSFLAALAALARARWPSFLLLAVVTGVGQARYIEFDRIAAFVASGCKTTKDETAQAQNNAAHLFSPGLARIRDGSLPAIAAPVKHIYTIHAST
jgi:hypothetical protein